MITAKMVKRAFEESKELSVELAILELSMNPQDKKKKRQVEQKINMVESWSNLLLPHEQYILQRHLVDKLSWSKLADEKTVVEGVENGCDERTLQRTQDRCLKRIAKFMTKKFGHSLDHLFV